MDFQKLHTYLSSLEEAGIPACDCLVRWNRQVVYRGIFGYADAERQRKTSPQDIYWLFSMTKVITMTAIMRLVDESKLSLDDPVENYLESFRHMTVFKDGKTEPARRSITIRQLMSMTSGLTYTLNSAALMDARKNPQATTREIIDALAKDPLAFEPGTRYQYSLGHDVLAAVLEVVTGMSFGEYLNRYVFAPLGMQNTGLFLSPEQESRMSAQYTYDMADFTSEWHETWNDYRLSKAYESGGAGLFSTVDDYSLFADALANGGQSAEGYPLLSENSINQMRTNQLDKTGLRDFHQSPRFFGYGYGLGVRTHMLPSISNAHSPVGEFGWDGAAGAYVLIDPETHLSIVYAQHIFNCSYSYEVIHTRIRDMVYDIIKGI